MELIIISGCSGAGKTCALHALEDEGYYSVDNLPVPLLANLLASLQQSSLAKSKIAVSIDIRNPIENFNAIKKTLANFKQENIKLSFIYLDAAIKSLITRYKTTRRRHPLDDGKNSLKEAVVAEKTLLAPLLSLADFTLDTSNFSIYQLKNWITDNFCHDKTKGLAIVLQSFGFKYGVPEDADFIFDVRCLPNPYWNPDLKAYTGLQQPIIDFLQAKPQVKNMLASIDNFLSNWISAFENSNRTYLMIAIGCTGGKHRSVYICNQLLNKFISRYEQVQIRHRDIYTSQMETLDFRAR